MIFAVLTYSAYTPISFWSEFLSNIGPVLTSTWVSSYTLTIVTGLWLALATANIVTLRMARARVLSVLSGLRMDLLVIRTHHPVELTDSILQLGRPILDSADDLVALGFRRTGQCMTFALLRIQNPLSESLSTRLIKEGLWLVGNSPTEEELLKAEKVFRGFIGPAISFADREAQNSIKMVRDFPLEWLRILELSTIASLVDWFRAKYFPRMGKFPWPTSSL